MKILGVARGQVTIIDYQPEWVMLYEEEKKKIINVLTTKLEQIHHVGSTAIEDMKAKPIIDIAIVVGKETIEEVKKRLEKIKYEYVEHPLEQSGRYFFVKRINGLSYYHVHVYTDEKNSIYKNQLYFRDYLNTNSESRDSYKKLKKDLMKKYGDDRATYTAAKNEYIQTILSLKK